MALGLTLIEGDGVQGLVRMVAGRAGWPANFVVEVSGLLYRLLTLPVLSRSPALTCSC